MTAMSEVRRRGGKSECPELGRHTQVGVRLPFLRPHGGDGEGSDGRPSKLTVFLNTSDAGSDQHSAARHLATALDTRCTGMVAQLCLMHQVHLIVLKGLHRTAQSRYLPRLGMVCHLWRSAGMVPKIKDKFAALFGEQVARRCASGPPPAPIRGRWGSVHDSESFILRSQWLQLRDVSGPQHGSSFSANVGALAGLAAWAGGSQASGRRH